MKIQAIFSDYDGTLCPLNVPREEAFIPETLLQVLNRISRKIAFGIITTKDLRFVEARVPFAKAISAISGLEVKIGDRKLSTHCSNRKLELVSSAYNVASEEFAKINSLVIERKTTSEGSLVAFCIDWRMCQNWTDVRSKVNPFLSNCKKAGLYVAESDCNPFADVYVARVDKGAAFLRLKHELGLEGPIMYLGDSEFDNPAFRQADVSIAILQVNVHGLKSEYFVKYDQLERFMAELIKANLDFVPSMARLHAKR